jgi:hypothetical protein
MMCQFRYVETKSDISVNLHLYRMLNGTPRGDVKGPVSPHVSGRGDVYHLDSCLPVDVAFASAIRVANTNDTELVVTGDRSLWAPSWGTLTADGKDFGPAEK